MEDDIFKDLEDRQKDILDNTVENEKEWEEAHE
jgi:hypothetical protein